MLNGMSESERYGQRTPLCKTPASDMLQFAAQMLPANPPHHTILPVTASANMHNHLQGIAVSTFNAGPVQYQQYQYHEQYHHHTEYHTQYEIAAATPPPQYQYDMTAAAGPPPPYSQLEYQYLPEQSYPMPVTIPATMPATMPVAIPAGMPVTMSDAMPEMVPEIMPAPDANVAEIMPPAIPAQHQSPIPQPPLDVSSGFPQAYHIPSPPPPQPPSTCYPMMPQPPIPERQCHPPSTPCTPNTASMSAIGKQMADYVLKTPSSVENTPTMSTTTVSGKLHSPSQLLHQQQQNTQQKASSPSSSSSSSEPTTKGDPPKMKLDKEENRAKVPATTPVASRPFESDDTLKPCDPVVRKLDLSDAAEDLKKSCDASRLRQHSVSTSNLRSGQVSRISIPDSAASLPCSPCRPLSATGSGLNSSFSSTLLKWSSDGTTLNKSEDKGDSGENQPPGSPLLSSTFASIAQKSFSVVSPVVHSPRRSRIAAKFTNPPITKSTPSITTNNVTNSTSSKKSAPKNPPASPPRDTSSSGKFEGKTTTTVPSTAAPSTSTASA